MVTALSPPAARHGTRALGTQVELLLADGSLMAPALEVLHAGLDRIDRLASRFRADSELSGLNRSTGRILPVSRSMLELVEVALRAAELTGGLVTPTVARALAKAGYDRDFAAMELFQPGRPATAAAVPGWESIRLDRAARTILVPPGVELDFGATAKAWAADRLAAELCERLGCGVLLSLGGDLAVHGDAPAFGWQVGIADRCTDEAADSQTVVRVQGGGLATSGTATRRWWRSGRLMHHVIDPRTGLPAASGWRTVSVCALSCVDANIAATAALIRGDDGPSWLEQLGLPARLVDDRGRVVRVGGWPPDAAEGAPRP